MQINKLEDTAEDPTPQQQRRPRLHIYTARPEQSINMQSSQQSLTFGFENPKLYPGIVRNSYNMSYKLIAKAFNDLWSFSLGRHGSGKLDAQFMTKVCKTDWIP